MNIFDYIRNYFVPSEPPPPVFGLENKSPYHPQAATYIANHGFPDRRLPDDYWQKLNYYRGQQVMPSGYTGNIATGPDAHLQDFGPIDSQYRTNRLIYPDEIAPRQGELGGLLYNDYQKRDARPLFVNGVQYLPRAPIEKNPRLTEKRRVIRMNTPAEKAAYLASQNERGFTLVGEPYTPQPATGIDGYISTNGTLVNRPSATGINGYISTDGTYVSPVSETRLAPRTMLSTERVPFNDAYRAGQSTTGTPYMSAGRAIKYMPQFLAQPEVAREMMRLAGRAGQGLGGAGILTDAYNRATSDYENPVTGETYSKNEVTNLDGLNYANADLQTIAMFHPDNADQHPEITDAMRDKFFKKKK